MDPIQTRSRHPAATVGSSRSARALLAALAAGALTLAACGDDGGGDEGSATTADAGDIAEGAGDLLDDVDADQAEEAAVELTRVLRANGLDSLASAVEQVDVAEMVGTDGFTLLAPNDEAFLALSGANAADLLADPGSLADVIGSHLIGEPLDAAALAERDTVTTVQGGPLDVSGHGGELEVGGAAVIESDIGAGSGMIHVVDRVILPDGGPGDG